ncbi:hypothetical protein PVAND_012646 [Polypedilum vanderplanki]|uniref:Peptidase S1 domain-containing protein n=1 Tax=Polypedilum vanderplanki TaxID=319348 RepID=A0A9J6CN37_POLVA|nr:hypothetical protein PVAND_012646 [Polypedilum vanderplanki]
MSSHHVFSIRRINSCGVSKFERNKSFIGLVVNGDESKPGEWPLIVSMFRKEKYFCGSSLISDLHLLSAAHCFEYFGITFQLNDYFALLGRFNLKDNNEKFSVNRSFSSIFLHSEFNNTAEAYRSNADIAVIQMSERVQFSDFIQPVCLPEPNSNLENFDGIVVGYGKNPLYSYIVAERSFCAGGTDAIPCLGDSGGGFYVKNNKSGKYETKGIVSQAQHNGCDPKVYVAFVDVTKFIDWIIEKMNE